MQDLILVGRQGSGKGTQGKILAETQGYKIFETGGELRRLAKSDSELGKKIKFIIESGELVSNEVIMEIVEDFLSSIDLETPVIFDGVPRFEQQRITLEEELKKAGREFQVLEIEISTEEAFKRLIKRAELEGRADDTPEVIQKRIDIFEAETAPMLEIWREQGRVISVNGEQDIEDVTKEMLVKLEQ